MSDFQDSRAHTGARVRVEAREGYDRWAATYDDDDNPLIAMTSVAMRRWAPRLEGRRVLELGCGTGRNAGFFAKAGCAEYVGVDASEGMLERARSRVPGDARVRWIGADIRALPADMHGFDLVFMSLVLEHVPAVVDVLAVAARATKPGGALHLCELHAALRAGGTQAHFRDGSRELLLPSYAHEEDEYREAAAATGWQIETMTSWHPTDEAITACAKLWRYAGRPVLIEVRAVRR